MQQIKNRRRNNKCNKCKKYKNVKGKEIGRWKSGNKDETRKTCTRVEKYNKQIKQGVEHVKMFENVKCNTKVNKTVSTGNQTNDIVKNVEAYNVKKCKMKKHVNMYKM